MKLAKLIYNPVAGDATFKTKLDFVCGRMQEFGYQIVPYRTNSSQDIDKSLDDLEELDYQAIFAAGGDGTIHQIINGLLAKKQKIAVKNIDLPPLGVIPAGTANDLAAHLGIPKEVEEWCDLIGRGKVTKIDLGLANDRYFHNVASSGLLTDVSHEVNHQLKNIMGKIAYYIKGIEKIPKFTAFPVTIKVDGNKVLEEEILLFLVLNGKSAGGFTKLAPRAEVTDGKLEVILIRDCSLRQLVALFLNIVQGEHLSSSKVEYFQAGSLEIKCREALPTDLDGEKGPDFPLQISVLSRILPVFVP